MEQSSSPSSTAWPPRRVALATLMVLAIACAFWILFQFRLVFFSLFIAIVLSTAIEPLISRLARFGVPRSVCILLITLIFLVLLIVAILSIVPLVSSQWLTITPLISHGYESLRNALAGSSSLLLQRMAISLPTSLPLAPTTSSGQPGLNLVQQALQLGSMLLQSLILITSVLLLTGLWILEGEAAKRVLLMTLPAHHRDPVREFIGDLEQKIGAYTRGLALLILVMGVLAGLAYLIIGLPNVLFLGMFAGLMEIVPLVGPLLGAIPAVLVAASAAPDKLYLVIIAYIIIQAAEGHLVVPRIMDRTVGVNPVASLLAFVAFGSIFGFLGALLAVPLAAVIQLILNRFVFMANPIDQAPPAGRGAVSALRYEAQKLVVDVRKQIREKDVEVSAREDRIEDSLETIATDLDSILAQAEEDHPNGSANHQRRSTDHGRRVR